MNRIKLVVPLLALLALGFMLSGCPKDKMMQNDGARSTIERTV